MEQAKGSNLMYIREEFKRRGKEVEDRFLAKLNPEERKNYMDALAFSWIPVTILASLWEKSVEILYTGGRKSALRKLGADTMRYNLKGLYKVAMHVTGIKFVFEQSARVWKTYHDTGNATCEKTSNKNEILFVISNYPTLPSVFQETVAGSFEAIIESGGSKVLKLDYRRRNTGEHEWLANWA
jgi:hypothetical protein